MSYKKAQECLCPTPLTMTHGGHIPTIPTLLGGPHCKHFEH